MPGLLSDPVGFAVGLLFKIPPLLVAVTVHELSHGLVADRLGDRTARLAGRLTLNPLPHLDPLGALAFVLAGFGWAKPVPVVAANLRHPARDLALVAVAGPVSNFVVGFVALLGVVLLRRGLGQGFAADLLGGILVLTFQFNLALGLFNMLPLPPLDGGYFVRYVLPARYAAAGAALERYGPFVLLLLVVTGATRHIVGPPFEWLVGLYVVLARLIL